MAVDDTGKVAAIDIAFQSDFTCNIDRSPLSFELFLIEMP